MLDADHGVLNTVLLRAAPGPRAAVPWLTSPGWALPAVILANIWIGIPFNLVILHGGLRAIPASLLRGGGTGRRRAVAAVPARHLAAAAAGRRRSC